MILLSNIIKGGRISSQTMIDLGKRLKSSEEVESIGLQTEDSNQEARKIYAEALQLKKSILKEAEQEALLLVATAKATALEEVKQAKKESEQILIHAKEESEKIILKAKEEMQKMIQEAQEEKKSILMSLEPEIATVIATLIQHIVHENVLQSTHWVERLVHKILMKEDLSEDVVLKISPLLYERLTQEELQRIKALKVSIDTKEGMKETSIVLETSQGAIEYDVSEGVKEVVRQIEILQNTGVENAYD